MADQENPKPPGILYEDTGGLAPLVYFDIVAAYGAMHGAVEVEFPSCFGTLRSIEKQSGLKLR